MADELPVPGLSHCPTLKGGGTWDTCPCGTKRGTDWDTWDTLAGKAQHHPLLPAASKTLGLSSGNRPPQLFFANWQLTKRPAMNRTTTME